MRGAERRRFPQIERLRRLDIVMAINHEVRAFRPDFARGLPCRTSGGGRFGDDDGMAGGGAQTRVQSDMPGVFDEPSGAGLHVLFVLRLGRDAGKTEVARTTPPRTGSGCVSNNRARLAWRLVNLRMARLPKQNFRRGCIAGLTTRRPPGQPWAEKQYETFRTFWRGGPRDRFPDGHLSLWNVWRVLRTSSKTSCS